MPLKAMETAHDVGFPGRLAQPGATATAIFWIYRGG